MKRENEAAGHRHGRLEEIVREEIRALLSDDVSDPVITGLRVHAVRLSVDYRHARVHVGLPADRVESEVERGLVRASSFLRVRLADAVDLKRVPELRFILEPPRVGDDDESEVSR